MIITVTYTSLDGKTKRRRFSKDSDKMSNYCTLGSFLDFINSSDNDNEVFLHPDNRKHLVQEFMNWCFTDKDKLSLAKELVEDIEGVNLTKDI